jgi:transposase-like protein
MMTFNCDNCGAEAKTKPSVYARNKHNFCSLECYCRFSGRNLPGQIPEDRFLELYMQGMNDRQIMRETGINHNTVTKWRMKKGLVAHGRMRKNVSSVVPLTSYQSARSYFEKRGEWEEQKARFRRLVEAWR